MATCKDCVHYEVCQMHYKQKCELTYETEREVRIAMRKAQKAVDIECDHYKDRSRFVELSIKPGALLYVPFRNQISKYMVIAVSISKFGVWIDRLLISGIDCSPVLTCVEAIGKTAFLSSKEAERILKERKGNDN